MAEPPRCPNRNCNKPMTYLGEEHSSYTFGCYSCGASRIITKGHTRDAARAVVSQQRAAASQPKPKRAYSFAASRTPTSKG